MILITHEKNKQLAEEFQKEFDIKSVGELHNILGFDDNKFYSWQNCLNAMRKYRLKRELEAV